METLPLNRLDEDKANTGQTVSRGRFPPVRTAIGLLLIGAVPVAVFRPGFRRGNDGGPVASTGFLTNTSGKFGVPQVAHGVYIPPEQWHDRRDFTAYVRPNGYVCTGTVSKNKVLTAKHCIEGMRTSHVTVQVSSRVNVWQSVTDIVTHPQLDVAILTFNGHHTNKKKLLLDGVTPAVGEQIRISGFGLTHSGSLGALHTSGPLQRVSCNHGTGVICASSGPSLHKSSCGGDSGGPWFQFRDNQQVVELVGVNSYGYDILDKRVGCGERDQKTGLVSVAYIKDWILQHAPEFEFTNDISCSDSDNGATDSYGDGCDWYTQNDHNGNNCGGFDDHDFKANAMCCHCGGGDKGSTLCKTSATNLECTFPFKYRGKTFEACAEVGFHKPWCATQTDWEGNYMRGKYALCSCS